MTPQRIAVLGATGSIGGSALDVIAQHPGRYRASVLSAHRNVDALAELCARFRPDLAIISDPALEGALAHKLGALGVDCMVAAGPVALEQAVAGALCDTVLAAVVGAAGLNSTLAAARSGKRLLLANKESAVCAGALLHAALREGGGALLPVDSEHNALFQCLPGGRPGDLATAGVRRLILTASGGPFRGRTRGELGHVTPAQACAHPNWVMGRKISVDSATLMNKGLEVIEACVLFGAERAQVDVLVHPQSLVHALVEYVDGAVLAELGHPDMRTALAQALAWPERTRSGVPFLDLAARGKLEFEHPDTATFRCLDLAYQALAAGGDAPAILNAANEIAVEAFLAGSLPFLAIADLIEAVLNALPAESVRDVASLVHRDLTARAKARAMLARMCC